MISSIYQVSLQPEECTMVEEAAKRRQQTIDEFLVSSIKEAAERALFQEGPTILSDRDRDLFLTMLDGPPEPTAALLRAAERHRREVG